MFMNDPHQLQKTINFNLIQKYREIDNALRTVELKRTHSNLLNMTGF